MTRTWTTFIFPVICLSLVAIERTSSRPMDSDHPFPSSQRSERNHLIMDDGNQGTTILDPYDPAGLLQVKDSYVRRKRQSGPEDVLPYCGPFLGRCRVIPRGECANVCINNVFRYACRVQDDSYGHAICRVSKYRVPQ